MRTIMVGSGVLVQGVFVKELSSGHIVVRAGEKEFTGLPVSSEK